MILLSTAAAFPHKSQRPPNPTQVRTKYLSQGEFLKKDVFKNIKTITEVSKLWTAGQLPSTSCFYSYWNIPRSTYFLGEHECFFPTKIPTESVVATKTFSPRKPKRFNIWTFAEKVCQCFRRTLKSDSFKREFQLIWEYDKY